MLPGDAPALETWDRLEVQSLAFQLSQATRDLKGTLRSDSKIRDGDLAGNPVISRFVDSIDGIEKGARQLSRRLAAGEGREETLPIAKKIRLLVREAEVQGRRIMVTVWMEKKFEVVGELLARLGRYYFDD